MVKHPLNLQLASLIAETVMLVGFVLAVRPRLVLRDRFPHQVKAHAPSALQGLTVFKELLLP
jgi:hypothetical protein